MLLTYFFFMIHSLRRLLFFKFFLKPWKTIDLALFWISTEISLNETTWILGIDPKEWQ